ncbi:arylesterase [Mongoliitalea daihaiensis]|jgi:acyl-CoA thioesterase I|uniref:arylesterase n=1 Tax=Mongoliitalea daihaiensis TaxID=2782006 RepID=UPI001F206CAC|nr:arylesterase [Mongoliitalea daihaiensis]UJP65350.1 arylesterase [Mongoliitalea daihaiensis]
MRNLNYFFLLALLSTACGQQPSEPIAEPISEQVEISSKKKTILFFGNSLTAGYGLDEDETFPYLIGGKLEQDGLEYKVVNAGLSGDTSASGLSRLDWFLEEEPAVFVLELGANDGLRGIDLAETKSNLKSILTKVRSKYPETVLILAGMQIPPNMGPEYTARFAEIYPEVAQEEQVYLIPFLLEGVAGDPDLNLPDGIHPTAEGQKIVATTVWTHLKGLL